MEIKATARTVRQPVTREVWLAHVAGLEPLGIIPIRDDNTCVWGVVDVDSYDVEFPELVGVLKKHGLPLVTCRSKSGGAHLFLFMADAVPSELMQSRLREMAALIGRGTSEIFPKQKAVALERGDLGNWLNMPYFGGDETDRYGVKPNGAAMTMEEFVHVAESLMQPRAFLDQSFRRMTEKQDVTGRHRRDPNFGDGPPCMQHLTTEGFPEGTRNKGLFALGVFAKKKYGDKWEGVLEGWNREFFEPPLPATEVMQIIRQLQKRSYNYTCKDTPLSLHCNASLCRTRRFGVGGEDDFPRVSGMSVIKSSPPLWFVDVDDRRVELTTEQLQSYTLFHRACIEQIYTCYRMMSTSDWIGVVSEAMRDAVEIDAPNEIGYEGHFLELVEEFVMSRHRAETREELLLGRPYEEDGRHYFRLRDLSKFLELAGFKIYTRPQIVTRLRALGGDRHFFNLHNNTKGVSVWWIPAMFVATPKIALPKMEREPI